MEVGCHHSACTDYGGCELIRDGPPFVEHRHCCLGVLLESCLQPHEPARVQEEGIQGVQGLKEGGLVVDGLAMGVEAA